MIKGLLLFVFLAGSAHGASILTPKVWKGELLESDQGGLALNSQILDFSAKIQEGSFAFQLQGRSHGNIYTFQTTPQPSKLPPHTVWKLKEDVYELMELSTIDSQGRKLSWKGPYRQAFTVKAGSLSLLGTWYLVHLRQGSGLSFVVKPSTQNLFAPQTLAGSFQSIIDGLSAQPLQKFLKKTTAPSQELRQTLRFRRSIMMTYALNLFRQNNMAPSMRDILETNDADLRSCYTDLLETQDSVQGTVAYTFIYSGEMQSIKALKVKHSDIKDSRFAECLYYKLLGLTFPLRKSLLGELTFQFKVSE